MKRLFIVLTPLLILGTGCANPTIQESTNWMGFYYPDFNDLNEYQIKDGLHSIEECRDWVNGQQDNYNPDRSKLDDYECGTDCEYKKEFDVYLCDKTIN
jgi:hypothetical protein